MSSTKPKKATTRKGTAKSTIATQQIPTASVTSGTPIVLPATEPPSTAPVKSSKDPQRERAAKQTIPVISKFERTALISQRASQIASGSPLTFRNEQKLTNPIELAKEEFRLKTIPLRVVRILPDGTEEVWHVREFKWWKIPLSFSTTYFYCLVIIKILAMFRRRDGVRHMLMAIDEEMEFLRYLLELDELDLRLLLFYFKMTEEDISPLVRSVVGSLERGPSGPSVIKQNAPFDLKSNSLVNENFRHAIDTGVHSQLVMMSLLPGEQIGMETHDDVDQFIYVVKGDGHCVLNGITYPIHSGYSISIKAGTTHNIVNGSVLQKKMKLFTIYSPPEHPAGTIELIRPFQQPLRMKNPRHRNRM